MNQQGKAWSNDWSSRLWKNWIIDNNSLHFFTSSHQSTWYCRHWLIVLFIRSLVLSISGWYALDILILMPVSAWRRIQNWEVKSLLWLEIISKGGPLLQYQSLKNTSTSSGVFIIIFISVICMSDPSLHIIDMIPSYPWSGGRGPMKLIVTESPLPSGIRRGCSGLTTHVVQLLFFWHSTQDGM